MPTGTEDVFEALKEMLTEILGADFVEIVGIQRDSTFTRDLEMDSITIAAFAERVNHRYGDHANLVAWISKQPLRKLIALTVGDVADFIGKEQT